MYQNNSLTTYNKVCSVLNGLADAAAHPANWRKPIYSAIDELHALPATQDQIGIAERISIALLKLDWAILNGDSDKEENARQQLAALGETWRSMADAIQANHSVDDVLDLLEVNSITEALERINQRKH